MTGQIRTATQKEFAAIVGKHKSYVTRLKQHGRLVLTDDGLVDVEASLKRIHDTSDPSRSEAVEKREAEKMVASGSGPERDADRYSEADDPDDNAMLDNTLIGHKTRTEKYKALTMKLEYEQAAGKLVEASEARLFAADIAATFRSTLEMLPDRLAPELIPMTDSEAIRALLVEEFEQILNDLADKIAKWGKR